MKHHRLIVFAAPLLPVALAAAFVFNARTPSPNTGRELLFPVSPGGVSSIMTVENDGAKSPEKTGDDAWKAIMEQFKALPPPKSGASPEEVEAWGKTQSAALLKIGQEIRAYYTQYPKHEHAADARTLEMNALMMAVRLDGDSASAKAKGILEERMKDEGLTDDQRFDYRMALLLLEERTPDAFVAGVREMAKDFPKNPKVAELIFLAAQQSDAVVARELLNELLKSDAPAFLKENAKKLLASLERVGKPLELKLPLLGNGEVDLAKLKGKVVAIDFWATWCPPCVEGMPAMKATYAKLKDKGFEIIGVSLDNNKEELEAFLKKEGITWPQSFDGKGMESETAKKFAINVVPTIWLVDKKGILREVNLRNIDEEKVEALLAEE